MRPQKKPQTLPHFSRKQSYVYGFFSRQWRLGKRLCARRSLSCRLKPLNVPTLYRDICKRNYFSWSIRKISQNFHFAGWQAANLPLLGERSLLTTVPNTPIPQVLAQRPQNRR